MATILWSVARISCASQSVNVNVSEMKAVAVQQLLPNFPPLVHPLTTSASKKGHCIARAQNIKDSTQKGGGGGGAVLTSFQLHLICS